MAYANFSIVTLKLRSSRAESNWPLRATVGQNSSSVQMASAYHVGAAVLAHVACSGQLDSALDERSFINLVPELNVMNHNARWYPVD